MEFYILGAATRSVRLCLIIRLCLVTNDVQCSYHSDCTASYEAITLFISDRCI